VAAPAPECRLQNSKKLQEIYIAVSSMASVTKRPKSRVGSVREHESGHHLSADSCRSVFDHARSRAGAQPPGKDVMTAMYGLAALLALFLFGYLVYALLSAERF
jgi:K+-transporting ATPase KdpF subunit